MDTAIKCTLTFTIVFFDTKDENCFLCAMKVGGVFFIHTVDWRAGEQYAIKAFPVVP